jgi:hypothetical protein
MVPSRASVVAAARANFAQRRFFEQRHPYAQQSSALPTIGLDWDFHNNAAHLLLDGPIGQAVRVDATTGLGIDAWQPFLTVRLPEQGLDWGLDWVDSMQNSFSSRFYRLNVPPEDPALELVDDFLLLDQDGKAHELFYPNNLKALAIVAAGDSVQQLNPFLAALKPFIQAYPNTSAQIWLVLNDPAAERTNVSAIVKAAGLSLPILLDPEGWGTRSMGFTHAGEVVVVQPPAFTVAYRGQLDLTSVDQPYFSAAFSGLVLTNAHPFLRTPLTGALLTAADAAVPEYSREIAPLFRQYCTICHRPNDVAPFAMTNYDVITQYAPAIKTDLLNGQMPPWHADTAYGQWSNSLAMPPAARSTLLRWIAAGTPRGSGPDPLAELPLPPSYRVWPADLGPPDAIVTPGPQEVKAFGTEPYRYLPVRSPNPSNVWLRAAIILPTSPGIVHHYLVWVGTNILSASTNGVSLYQDNLALYVPGMAPYLYPSDSGYSLGKSNWLTFNLHYTPNGLDTNDVPTLALWYHKSKPPKNYHSTSVSNGSFRIPPGNPEYAVQSDTWLLDHSIRLHRIYPHMHLRGKRANLEFVYPGGVRETILSVPDYDFRWQLGYEFAEPKLLPAGTQITMKGAFDNSAQNLANPNPAAFVKWGDQTSSEMFVGFIDYVDNLP